MRLPVFFAIHHAVSNQGLDLQQNHRRTNQGAGGYSPPDSGKAIIFRTKANFFRAEASSQREKKNLFVKRKKRIHSV